MTAQMLTIRETAAELGIGESTAYDLIKRGDFPVAVQRVGAVMKVSRIRLDRFLAGDLPKAVGA